ncbi:uncharacterized protein EHS24_004353 [Apiotrichum porosum]|uniref:Uncharacterized protein n=1 Tax=Apiotrichum porosum TaxID=105984 RepID=A0A427Y4X9_9TREE|nr:uncharacterized protein EHS24_004353 [Apiotrichum porosum]RSH86125.1 hypothetical protein EHS24_004353 [Apiotrichum porosum]
MQEDSLPDAGPSEQLEQSAWPAPPQYNWSASPGVMTSVDATNLSSEVQGCFFRSARWTADASSVLTTAEDRVLRVYDIVYDGDAPCFSTARELPQPDAINAALWYPSASAHAPETFCFVASTRDSPVRLVDAGDGRIRASYPIVDHRERFISPHSFAFNTTATKLYCGFENAIEVLDIASPGYHNSDRLKMGLTRKEKGGQKGIISALAFSQHMPGAFAAGSFSGSVVLYDEDTGNRAAGHLYGVEGGGVTQLVYHPLDPNTIFVASRRSDSLQAYDLRDTSQPVARLERPTSTNQRIWFDVDPWGRWLASGDENGTVRIWDIGSPSYDAVADLKLHNDAVNSVQFHPFKPLLLTSAGSRAFLQSEDLELSSDESDSDSDSNDEPAPISIKTGPKDSRMAIWSMAA